MDVHVPGPPEMFCPRVRPSPVFSAALARLAFSGSAVDVGPGLGGGE